jgi:hypothetical protein
MAAIIIGLLIWSIYKRCIKIIKNKKLEDEYQQFEVITIKNNTAT